MNRCKCVVHVAVEFTTHTYIQCIFPCATSPPQILIAVSYFIASGFMSVFHMAVDTIFICACELICPAAVYSCHNNYSVLYNNVMGRICRCVSCTCSRLSEDIIIGKARVRG